MRAGCRWESAGAFSIGHGDVRAHKDHGMGVVCAGCLVSVSVFVLISSCEVLLFYFIFQELPFYRSARNKSGVSYVRSPSCRHRA